MAQNVTPKDKKILRYLSRNYTCHICKNILIECVTFSCGHHYCSYCFDLLMAGSIGNCPECSSPIQPVQSNRAVNREIRNLISSCSEVIQREYTSAVNARSQKSLNQGSIAGHTRTHENVLKHSRTDLMVQSQQMKTNSKTADMLSERKHADLQRGTLKTAPNGNTIKPRSKPLTISTPNTARIKPTDSDKKGEGNVDIDKVSQLFGIYDNVLKARKSNEPKQNLAGGDFTRQGDEQNDEKDKAYETKLAEIAKQNELEIRSLIKETDDIIKLDSHIQKWSVKMKEALTKNDSYGLKDEVFDSHVHAVDDELWKASKELLRKLQGIQMKRKESRKCLTSSCPPTPLVRSNKLNVEAVSDDSDADEYEHTLETLQASVDNSRSSANNVDSCGHGGESNENFVSTTNLHTGSGIKDVTLHNQGTTSPSMFGNRPTSRHTTLEESGQAYVRENIDFVTKLRQYKDALMKIQNREAVTAEQIKDLVPSCSSTMDGTTLAPILKKHGNKSARLAGFNQNGRQNNFSCTARLSSTTLEAPKITSTYETLSSKSAHTQNAVGRPNQCPKQSTCRNHLLFTSR